MKLFDNNKKGISPVVAVALLMVLSVSAVVGFQTWFQTYSSGLFTKAESQDLSTISGVENIIGDELFFKNGGNRNISIERVKVGENDCDVKVNSSSGIQSINLGSCIDNLSGSAEVVVYTDDKIFSKSIYLDTSSSNQGSGGGASSLSLSCQTDVDGDGFFNYTCAIYPMNETLTLEGHLDPDDSVSQVQPDTSCVWNNDKTGCLSNYIDNGCGSETVLDSATSLCWDKNFNRVGQLNWTNAKQYCLGLNTPTGDTHPSGDRNWYLPSRQEFETIVDLSRSSSPHIAGGTSIFNNVQSSSYWTRSDYMQYASSAFKVNLLSGNSDYFSSADPYYLVCVRRN